MPNNLSGFSYLKVILIWTFILTIAIGGFIFWNFNLAETATIVKYKNEDVYDENEKMQDDEMDGINAFEDTEEEPDIEGVIQTSVDEKVALQSSKAPKNPSDTSNNFNILILGIDRRHGDQTHWRTDVIQLLTLNPDRSKGVITHIPRDVWADTYKINAIYNLQGPDAIKDKVQEVTGQRPDRIIRIDFDAFVWVVDSVGGLTIDVPVGFTDESYPRDREGIEGAMVATFDKGPQTMDGETALIYVRSRKGNNGQGSDYARGTRQQQVMEQITDDFFQPDNLFSPKTAETLYKIATQKIYTDITLSDTKVLFDVLKNYKDIEITQLGLDTSNYLVVPSDRAAYGGAWTLVAKNGDFSPIHEEINNNLSIDYQSPEADAIITDL